MTLAGGVSTTDYKARGLDRTSATEQCPECEFFGPLAGLPHCFRCSAEKGRGVHHTADRKHPGECSKVGCTQDALRHGKNQKAGMYCAEHEAPLGGGREAFIEASKELAAELGQGIHRDGNTFYVPSRTRLDARHRIDLAVDGTLVCNCEAAANERDCWAVKLVREELKMSESTALVPIKVQLPQAHLPTANELMLIDRAASMAFEGKIALPKELDSPKKVAAIMLMGWELGLKPMTAIRSIYLIEGRPQPSAEVMAGLLMDYEPDSRLSVEELTEEKCTMRLRRPKRGINETYTVSVTDSDVALLIKRDSGGSGGWTRFRRDRLRWHCTKRLLRIYAPDALNGLRGSSFAAEDDGPDRTDAIDMAELYNEGDTMAQEGAGPLQPNAPASGAVLPDKQALAAECIALFEEMRTTVDPEYFKDRSVAIKELFPAAIHNGKFAPGYLEAPDCMALRVVLNDAIGRPSDSPAKQEILI